MRQLSSPWSHLPERAAAQEPVRHEDIHPPPRSWTVVRRRVRELSASSVVVIGLCLLLMLAVLSSCLRGDDHPSASARPVASTTAVAPAAAAPAAATQASSGMTLGTVIATDGANLTVQAILGGTVVVHSIPTTEVLALSGGRISAIAVGYSVFVNGDRNPDGSIVASLIIGGPLNLSGK